MQLYIGDSYFSSIGDTNGCTVQALPMAKKLVRTFWARAKEALAEARLPATQVFVARFLGVAQPSISDWNKPGGFPTLENGIRLAQKLNVCVEWLYTERGPKRPIPDDPVAQRLWDAWPLLDDVTRGELVGIATSRAIRPESDDETDLKSTQRA
jgi:hypothetical protein